MKQVLLFGATRNSKKPSFKRVMTALAVLLLSVLSMGTVQAQDCEIDGSEFTFEVLKASSSYTKIHWAKVASVQNFKGLKFYFTDDNSGETHRFTEQHSEDTTGDFITNNLPAGTYTWAVRAYCTNGDSSTAMEQGSIEIVDAPPCSFLDGNMFSFEVIQANTALTKINWSRSDGHGLDYFDGQMAFYFTNDNTGQTYRFNASTGYQWSGGMGTSQLPAGTYTWYARAYCTDGDSSNAIDQGSIEIIDGPFTATIHCDQNPSQPTWGEYVDAIYNGSSYEFMVSFSANINGDDGYTYDSLTRVEVQYKRSDKSEWDSVFQDYYHSDTTLYNGQEAIWIPVNSKGVWQARARVISGNGQAGEWSDTLTNPIYFWTDDPLDDFFTIYDNTGHNRDILCGYNDTLAVDFQKAYDDNQKCGRWFEYFLVNPQGDTIDGPNDGSVSVAWLENITEPGTYTIAVTIEVAEAGLYAPTPYDTTFTIGAITSCDIPSDGSSDLNIIGFTWGDDDPPAPDFFYLIKVPFTTEVLHGGDLVSVEAQYRKTGEEEWTSIYLDASTGDSIIELPITSKGNWEVRMRARCCGSYPGNLPGDWVLTDTIHQYASTLISSLTYTDVCHGDDGTVALELAMPYNIEYPCEHPRCVDLGWFLVNAADSSYVATDNCVETPIEVNDLAEGTYLLITKLTDNECGWFANSFDAFFDTSFTIGRKINVTIENDSSVFCSNDSVLYRAIVTGGTEPYSYEWGALETTYGTDVTLWITGNLYGDSAPSVTVTDASGCINDKSFHFTINPAYTEEDEDFVHNMFGDNNYTYSRNRNIITSQLPFTIQDYTFDGTDEFGNHEFNFQTANGCDSIVHIDFTQKPGIALPSSGNLDTTITTGVDVYDDGGLSSAAALHADRTLTLHAPEGSTLELQLTGTTFNFGEGEALYVYDYNGVNDNMLLFEYRQGMNPPNTDFTSNSRSLTFRYVTGNSCEKGFIMTVNTKDISNECLPVYNVTYRTVSAETMYLCYMQWEYNGVADSFEVKCAGLQWNDATSKYDTVNNPETQYVTDGSNWAQIGFYPPATMGRAEIRAICGEGDTSVVTSFDWAPPQPLKIPTSGDTIVTLDPTVENIYVYDAGGLSGNYSNNSNGSLIVKPADGYRLIVDQNMPYDVESDYDYLYITDDYEGSAVNIYQIDTLTGEGTTNVMESRSGGLKFTLTSDESDTKSGLEILLHQQKLSECLPSYNPKAERRLMDITTYYEITDAGIYGSTAGDRMVVKKTNVTTNAITYDTMTLEMGDNSLVLTIEPQYTMDVQLAPLCGYGNATQWSDPMRLSACQMPYSIMPDTVKETSAYITWEGDAAQFLMFYRKTGLNMWDTVVVSGNSHWMTSLAPMTNYEVALQAICSEGDTSLMSNTYATFYTGCGFRPGLADGESYTAPATMSWSEDNDYELFGQMPPCWERIGCQVNDSILSLLDLSDGNTTFPQLEDVFGGDDNWSAIYFYTNAEEDQYAIMPKFDTIYGGMNQWALNFTLELGNYNHGTWCDSKPVVLYVGVMDDPNDASSFTAVDSIYAYSNEYDNYYGYQYFNIPLANYSGDGLYPAFKMARRSMHNSDNDYTNPTLLLYDVLVIPNGDLIAPIDVTVTEHPTDDSKAVVSWTEPAWPSYDDDYSVKYEITKTTSSGDITTDDVNFGQTNYTFTPNAGEVTTISIATMVTSARYNTSWRSMSAVVKYETPLRGHQVVDSIGDLTQESHYASSVMPFEYGNKVSSEILIKADEIDVTSIDAIAFHLTPESCKPGTSFQWVRIYMKDVTLTELDAQNMTDDYLFSEDNVVYPDSSISVGNDGWLTFKLNTTFTHNPSNNLLIGVASREGDYAEYYRGYTKFYLEDNQNDNLALWFEGTSDLTTMPDLHDQYNRPQMKLISTKNCTNDSVIVDTNLCENSSIDWRGQTISFSDDDIELHKVAIDSTYNYGWDYTYAYVFNDKVEGLGTGGCDSIYQLRITKRYNEDNNYALENDGFPHVVNCGPYTWRNGVTYDYSMGTYVIHEEGQCDSYDSHGPRVYDTVPGVTSYGCDSIYGLNLTVEPWYTVVFDTTGVDLGTGMAPVNICEGENYDLPQCTMTMAYKNFVAWEIDGEWYDEGDAYESDWIEGDTLYVRPVFECDVEEVYTEYEEFCPNGGEYEWRGKTITMDYALQHGRRDSIAGVDYINVYDTVAGAVGGVCDSIYTLRLRMENKIRFDERVINQCQANGWYWDEDFNHYGSDMGWRWVDDGDDGHKEFDMSTAARYIDPFANGECGRLYLLSLEIEDDGEDHDIDTVIFIKYKIEWGDGIDTLHSMTMYVCDDNEYFVPECPDTVTREGYDFVYWSDWPECGWEVEPGSSQYAGSGTIYLYGMWESNCEDKEAADTTVMCPNDTLSWHGFTLRGPELQIGEWDSVMTKYGVIPGECDSIYHMHVTVLSRPTLSVTSQGEPLCAGMSTGWVSVAVSEGNTPFQYAMGDSSYTAALDTTEHKFENLAAGTHTVWVKDACGVTDNIEVTITQPTEIMITNMQAYDSTACYGSSHSVNLAVDGGTSPYTYLWNSDINHMESYLEINTNVAGTHNDTILVTDANGCTATASYTTKVYDSLSVSVSGNDTTYCYGATATPLVVTVEGGVTDSGYTYQWYNYGTAIDGATGSSFTVPTTSGVQYDNITVMVDNICGAKTVAAPSITVLDSLRLVAYTNDGTICFGANTAQMEVDVQGGGAFTGQWYMNGTAVTDHNPGDAANKYTPRTDTAGTFTYSLKVTSNAGCGSDSVQVKTLTVYDVLTAESLSNDTTICMRYRDTLYVSVAGGSGSYSYQWQKDNTDISDATEESYKLRAEEAGTSVYSVRVTDNSGCGDTTITIATVTVPESISLDTMISASYCFGAPAETITLEPTGGNGTYEYLWQVADNDDMMGADTLSVTGNSYTPTTDSASGYYYRVRVFSGGCSNEFDVARIYVMEPVVMQSTADSLAICLGTEGNMYDLTDLTSGGNDYEYTYKWFKNGVEIDGETSGIYTPVGSAAGTFTYRAIAIDDMGCMSDTATIGVLTVYDEMAVTVASQDTTYCYGAQADTLKVTSITSGSGNYSYTWMQNNDIVDEGETYVPSTTEVGETVYSVQVTDEECGTDTTITVAVITVYGNNVTHDTLVACDSLQWVDGNYYAMSVQEMDTVPYYVFAAADQHGCDSTVYLNKLTIYETMHVSADNGESLVCIFDTVDIANNDNPWTLVGPVSHTGGSSIIYTWYRNGNAMDSHSSDSEFNLKYTTVGVYNYSVVATDSLGCGRDSISVGTHIVSRPFILSKNNADTINYCINSEADTLGLNITYGSGHYLYQWLEDGEDVANGSDSLYVPSTNEAGTHTYSLRLFDSICGTDTTVTMATITVSPTLVASIEPDTLYNCMGNEGSFTVTVAGGSEPTYKWYRNGEFIADETSADINFDADSAGTFTYSVVVTDGAGCGRDSLYAGRSIVYSPMAVTAENHDTAYCYGVPADTLRLNVSGGSGNYNYRWFVHDYYETVLGTTAKYKPSTDESGTTIYDVVVSDTECGTDTTFTVAVVTVYGDDVTHDTLVACDSLQWVDGNYYAMSVQEMDTVPYYVFAAADQHGCDSTVTLNLTVNYSNHDTVTQTSCDIYTWMMTGQSYTTSGYYFDTVQNMAGCDSIVMLNLTVNPSTASNDTVTACDSYAWNNTDYNTSGTYTANLINAVGCDSTATLYLTINYSNSDTVTQTACDSYIWTMTGETYTASGVYYDTVQNQYGCDSTVTLNLTVNHSNSDTVTQTACDNYTWAMTGETYSVSGVYYDTVQNLAGCDSIVVLNLTVNYSNSDTVTQTSCDIYTWMMTGQTYTTSGVYYDTVQNQAGCDSIVMLDLTVNPSTASSDSVTVCDSYTWNNTDYNTSGTYTANLFTAAGCDSTATLYLTIAENYLAYFITGYDSLQNVNTSMDTIVVCSLTPQVVLPENEYVYELHEFIGWYNQATGDTVQPGDTVLMTESLTFNTVWRALCSNVDTVSYATICDGDTITWRGYTVTSAQAEYADTVAGVVDVLCDSVYHLLLSVNYPTTSDTTMLACDSVWWNNMFFTETPDTTQSFFMAGGNQYGCDSTAYLNLTVNYSIHDYVVETACDRYVFDNATYTESTDLPTIGAISDNGCPFITHISLTVNYSYHGEDSATACDMYVWNDMELTQGGDHDFVSYTADGCDSIITLHLTLHTTTTGIDSYTACDSLTWIDGNIYFSDFPGDAAEITYLMEGANQYGCDSIAILDLTMMEHIYVEFLTDYGEGWMDEMAACRMKPLVIPECAYVNDGFVFDGWTNQMDSVKVQPGDTVYLETSMSYYATWRALCEDVIVFTDTTMCEGSTFVWRGHDYTNDLFSGDYEDVAYGVIENYCDSVYYLRLTVFPLSRNEYYDTAVGPYYWYDDEYTATGDYERHTGYNRFGCDSTEVLHLVINLGVTTPEEIDLTIYPNPTSGRVNIEGVGIKRITVVDMVGRTMATFDDQTQIDISDLPAGHYTLLIETTQGNTTRRIIKR